MTDNGAMTLTISMQIRLEKLRVCFNDCSEPCMFVAISLGTVSVNMYKTASVIYMSIYFISSQPQEKLPSPPSPSREHHLLLCDS